MSQPTNERRFDRGAWLHLLLMVALITVAVSSVIYRFSLPTDGWMAYEPESFGSFGLIYERNVMNAPSALRPGDHLIAIEGLSLDGDGLATFWPLRDGWQSGASATYTVMRDDQELELEIPLTRWRLSTYVHGSGATLTDLIGHLGIVAFLVVAFVAFWRRPDNPTARALWVLAAVIFAIFVAIDLLPAMMADRVFPLATLSVTGLIFMTFTILLPPAVIRLAMVFPQPIPALERRPWIAYLPYAVGAVGLVAFAMQFFVFGWAWTATSFAIALVILIYNAIISRDAVSRAQLRWGLGGMVVGVAFFLLTFIPVFFPVPEAAESLLNALSALSFGIMGITLGIAVMRYRLFDIDVIIRRTTSYAILTALLVLVYFGSVVVLQRILAPITGESTIAVVLSTLLIAALFLPLRRRVQAAIDKRFFRQKYDAEQVLAQFAATVRDETDLDELTAELVRVIQETMQPASVSVWLAPVTTSQQVPIAPLSETGISVGAE